MHQPLDITSKQEYCVRGLHWVELRNTMIIGPGHDDSLACRHAFAPTPPAMQ